MIENIGNKLFDNPFSLYINYRITFVNHNDVTGPIPETSFIFHVKFDMGIGLISYTSFIIFFVAL